jgi:hypothetical protein
MWTKIDIQTMHELMEGGGPYEMRWLAIDRLALARNLSAFASSDKFEPHGG